MAAENTENTSDDLVDDLRSKAVITEPAGPSILARVGAEVAGTFILVLLGAGTHLLLRYTGNGTVVAGLGFGFGAMIAMIAFAHISGAHLNPAVTVGAWIAGRISGFDVIPYILGQVAGGILAGLALRLGIDSLAGVDGEQVSGLMSTVSIGHGDRSPFVAEGLAWGLGVAIAIELLATALLVLVVLSATAKRAPAAIAPFAIGLAIAALVTFTIPFTNAALNPARATGTAVFADDWAQSILWAWWVAPIVGAAIVGLAFRVFGPGEDLVAVASADAD